MVLPEEGAGEEENVDVAAEVDTRHHRYHVLCAEHGQRQRQILCTHQGQPAQTHNTMSFGKRIVGATKENT